MAEANVGASGNGQGGTQPQSQAPANQDSGVTQGQQAQQPANADPSWLGYVPEQHREEARKGYLMESDYRKKTTELSEGRKAWETEKASMLEQKKALEDWWKQFEPTYKTISSNWDKINFATTNWDKIQAALNGQQTNQPAQQVDPFQDFDILPGKEQAKRLADFANAEVERRFAERDKQYDSKTAQREQYYQNYINILTDGFTKKLENPALDLPAYMQKALEFSYGKFNPQELAYQAMTRDGDMKKMQEEWLKKGKEEALAEMRNQQQPAGANNSTFVMPHKQSVLTREQAMEATRQAMVAKGIPWGDTN